MADAPPQLADPRVIFAAERTLLAWIRTGLSLMGFGFAIARFGLYLREITPPGKEARFHFSVPFGVLLVGFGVLSNLLAVRSHAASIERLRRGESMFEPKLSPAVIIAGTLALVGIATCVFLLTTNPT